MPVPYESNGEQSLCMTDEAGEQRFERVLMGNKPEKLPSFVGKVYTEEELLQSVDEQIQKNQCNKKSLADMIKDSCIGWSRATFKFVGEDKTYGFYDFIDELNRHSEEKRSK